MSNSSLRVLVLCTGNSARSILGEAIFNHLGAGRVTAVSAGSKPTGTPNPYAIKHLESEGIDTSFARSKSWDEFAVEGAEAIDLVITVCDSAASEECPYWPGGPLTVHWGLPDPAYVEGDAEKTAAFAYTWKQLKHRAEQALALPLETMDKADLKAKLSDIGKSLAP